LDTKRFSILKSLSRSTILESLWVLFVFVPDRFISTVRWLVVLPFCVIGRNCVRQMFAHEKRQYLVPRDLLPNYVALISRACSAITGPLRWRESAPFSPHTASGRVLPIYDLRGRDYLVAVVRQDVAKLPDR